MGRPANPGQILAGKFVVLGVLLTELARQFHVPANRITQIIQGKLVITGDFALRLVHSFCDAHEFWMGLQAQHELREPSREAGREIQTLTWHPAQAGAR